MPWIGNVSERSARGSAAHTDTVVISITEPGFRAALGTGWADILRLQFHDAEKPDIGVVLMNEEQASMAAQFARHYRGKNILVHCEAGISRSGAVVEALLQAFPEYEDRGWPRQPNNHVRSLMKRALEKRPMSEGHPLGHPYEEGHDRKGADGLGVCIKCFRLRADHEAPEARGPQADEVGSGCDGPCFTKQDSAFKPGQQGRLSDATWAVKEFPEVRT